MENERRKEIYIYREKMKEGTEGEMEGQRDLKRREREREREGSQMERESKTLIAQSRYDEKACREER